MSFLCHFDEWPLWCDSWPWLCLHCNPQLLYPFRLIVERWKQPVLSRCPTKPPEPSLGVALPLPEMPLLPWGKAPACLNPPFTESTIYYPVLSLTVVSFPANPRNYLKKPVTSGVRVPRPLVPMKPAAHSTKHTTRSLSATPL